VGEAERIRGKRWWWCGHQSGGTGFKLAANLDGTDKWEEKGCQERKVCF
jgi:hypothetical protein